MFTYLSSIIVFLLAGVIIKTKDDGNNELTWDDCWSMQSLCYIISAIGLVTTVVFQIFTPEKASSTNMLESTMVATIRLVQIMSVESWFPMATGEWKLTVIFRENYLSVSKWFKRPGFYRTCALYTLTRMIYNLTQVSVQSFSLALFRCPVLGSKRPAPRGRPLETIPIPSNLILVLHSSLCFGSNELPN